MIEPVANPASVGALLAQGHAAVQAGRNDEAARLLAQAAACDPAHAGVQHLLGIALERRGDPRGAMRAFARALALAPGLTDVAERASALLMARGDRRAAAACLIASAAAAADPVAGGLARARACALLERHADAASALRAVLAHRPEHAEAWRLLGATLSVAGEVEAGRAAFRRAMQADPDDAAAVLDLVRSARTTEADRTLVQAIARRLDGTGTLSARQRMLLGFALGKAHDDLNEPAAAIRAFDAANAIRARSSPFDRTGFAADVDRMIAAFPVGMDAAPDGGGARAVLILGMPRSGTTLIEQILSSHPDVAAGGEMAFWGAAGQAWLAAPDRAALARLRNRHAKALDAISANAALVTDKNPFNFAWLGLIRLVLPDAYVIHCRRDPRDTCLSAYMTLFSAGNAWAARREDLAFVYRQYVRLMAHWRAVLPARRFLEIDYELVVAAPEAAARALVAFCGLKWNEACLRPEANRRPVHTASVYQARERVHARSVGRWRAYAPWLGELATLQDSRAAPSAET